MTQEDQGNVYNRLTKLQLDTPSEGIGELQGKKYKFGDYTRAFR